MNKKLNFISQILLMTGWLLTNNNLQTHAQNSPSDTNQQKEVKTTENKSSAIKYFNLGIQSIEEKEHKKAVKYFT